MKARGLSPRDRRALLIGAVALLPGVLWRFEVAPFLEAVRGREQRLEAERALLARELDLLAHADLYPRLLEEARRSRARAHERLFDAADPALAAADVVDYLERVATESRLTVGSVTAAAPKPIPGGFTTLPVELRGESDFEGVLRFIRGIERGPKLLRITELAITGPDRTPPGSPQPPFERLAFSLEVAGFMLGEPPTPAPRAARGGPVGASPEGRVSP